MTINIRNCLDSKLGEYTVIFKNNIVRKQHNFVEICTLYSKQEYLNMYQTYCSTYIGLLKKGARIFRNNLE